MDMIKRVSQFIGSKVEEPLLSLRKSDVLVLSGLKHTQVLLNQPRIVQWGFW